MPVAENWNSIVHLVGSHSLVMARHGPGLGAQHAALSDLRRQFTTPPSGSCNWIDYDRLSRALNL
jgi:hypothetical protein